MIYKIKNQDMLKIKCLLVNLKKEKKILKN
jgi:hypothetical protein